MSKKIIYLATFAGSIVAAGIEKFHDESVIVIPSDDAEKVDPIEVFKRVFPDKKVPYAVTLLGLEALENPENVDGDNLAMAIQLYAYDVNDPNTFQTIISLLQEDRNFLKDFSAKGAIINELKDHEDRVDALIEKYADQDERVSKYDVQEEEASANDELDDQDNVIDLNKKNDTSADPNKLKEDAANSAGSDAPHKPADENEQVNDGNNGGVGSDANNDVNEADNANNEAEDSNNANSNTVNTSNSGNTVEGADTNVASDGKGAKALPGDVANIDGDTKKTPPKAKS